MSRPDLHSRNGHVDVTASEKQGRREACVTSPKQPLQRWRLTAALCGLTPFISMEHVVRKAYLVFLSKALKSHSSATDL